MNLANKVVLITGAGSGIGRALARSLATRGCHLALVDIDAAGLEATGASISTASIHLTTHVIDVSDREAIADLPATVYAAHGKLDVLINNAGVGLAGTFLQLKETDFDWLMSINFAAVVDLTRAFLPHLLERPEAMLVNLSSIYGIVSPVGNTAYSASKFAVRGFSNALRHELSATAVRVCVVHPGGVATRIATSTRHSDQQSAREIADHQREMKKLLRMPPGTGRGNHRARHGKEQGENNRGLRRPGPRRDRTHYARTLRQVARLPDEVKK